MHYLLLSNDFGWQLIGNIGQELLELVELGLVLPALSEQGDLLPEPFGSDVAACSLVLRGGILPVSVF